MVQELISDTLNLILLPTEIDESSYISEIEENLRELEGDYYTFLNKDNLQKLADNNLLNSHLMILLDEIRQDISAVNPALWNSKDFITNSQWMAIREKAIFVLAEL